MVPFLAHPVFRRISGSSRSEWSNVQWLPGAVLHLSDKLGEFSQWQPSPVDNDMATKKRGRS